MIKKVIGPPGTGKTTWIGRQVSLAVEAGHTPMVVSLTRAAAAEARGEVTLPNAYVGTLHAQAYHALNRPTLAQSGPLRKLWNEKYPYFRITVGDGDLDDRTTESEFYGQYAGDGLLSSYDLARARGGHFTTQQQAFGEQWGQWKAEHKAMDFTDLIERSVESVSNAPGNPSVIFVDEAQDLNVPETALVRKWGAAAGRLVLVGDPWQNLYRWRGANPALLDAADVVLKQSHRVPGAVHEVALRWMTRCGYTGLEYLPTDAEGEVRQGRGTWRYPDLADVRADLAAGLSVMMLTACSFQLAHILRALCESGMPFGNRWRLKNATWNPLKGGAPERVSAFLDLSTGAELTLDRLRKWTEVVGIEAMLRKGVRRKDLNALPVDDEGVLDLGAATDLLTEDGMDNALRGDLEWLAANAMKQYGLGLAYAARVVELNGVSALTDEPPLTIGTIHSTKGSEADAVYLFPDLSNSGAEQFGDFQGPGRGDVARQFYVGLTRAREKLVLMPAQGRKAVEWPVKW